MDSITSKASVLSQLSAQCSTSGSGMFIAQGIEERVTILVFNDDLSNSSPTLYDQSDYVIFG